MAFKTTQREKLKPTEIIGICIRSLFKLAGSGLLIAGIVVCFIGAGFILSCMKEAFNFNPEEFSIGRTSTIFYVNEDGRTVEYQSVNSSSNRQWVKYEKIPKYMRDAAVAIEDQRFYTHHGVDLKRTLSALLVNVTGQDSYGGSTITQQVVKNITEDNERDAMRKVREIFRAFKFESEYSKEEILEFYLNIAHFGYGNGVQAASYRYFGKDVTDLNLAECASIVGITKYPAKYNPLKNPAENKKRQETVLKKMLELDMISPKEYKEAKKYELVFLEEPIVKKDEVMQTYFTELVIDQVTKDLMSEYNYTEAVAKSIIHNGGLTIYATVDPEIQSIMENVLSDISGYTTESGVQAAMVIIDPYTGEVKGCVGGVGEKDHDLALNRAVDTYRQPGSTMKPIGVYGPAMEEGIISSPGSAIYDKAIKIGNWSPKNYYKGYMGRTTIRRAIELSMNTPAAQVADKLGLDVMLDYMKNKYHISSLSSQDGLAISLGGFTKGVNVLEWTAAYTVFPNKGEWISPTVYTKVVDHSGKVILNRKAKSERVFSKETAFMMTDILVTTARSMNGSIPGMSCGGKTGTTDNYVDKWYMGFTPYYVCGVWTGKDNPTGMNDYRTYELPQKLWKAVMSQVHSDLDDIGFPSAPSSIKKAYVCAYTGELASRVCSGTYDYVDTDKIGYCKGKHYVAPAPEKKEEKKIEPQAPEVTPENPGTTEGSESIAPSDNPGTETTPSVPEVESTPPAPSTPAPSTPSAPEPPATSEPPAASEPPAVHDSPPVVETPAA